MRRKAQFLREFERLAADWPETARFLVDVFRRYPAGGVNVYVPRVRRYRSGRVLLPSRVSTTMSDATRKPPRKSRDTSGSRGA